MFNTTGNGYTLSDIAAVSGRSGNGGWGEDGSWWIILLFMFAFGGWGNGGFGGNRNGATTREEIAYGFDMNGLENGVRGIQQGLCDGFYAMNTGMLNGFSNIQNSLCQGFSGVNTAINTGVNTISGQLFNMAADSAMCCCQTQREIERGFADTNYNLATQSCDTRRAISDAARDIVDNQNNNTRSILDFLTQDKISTLQAENQALRFAASQSAQNAYLVNELKQCPVPAYVVPNPYCGCGYGYNATGC
jgi:hypothetical protein